jgi:hypothetical protein
LYQIIGNSQRENPDRFFQVAQERSRSRRSSMRTNLTDDVKAGILVKGDFTYAEMTSLAKEVLSQMGETKGIFMKEDAKAKLFYLAFFVNRLDALLWGQGGGFLATLSKNKAANLVAIGEYKKGTLTIKVQSGIVARRSTLSAKRLEAIESFYEFIKVFHERVKAVGKNAECTIGLSEEASNLSIRRKASILGGR